jgi:hypothetical protein
VRYGEEENKLPQSSFRWKVNYYLYPFFAKNEDWRRGNEIRATVNISKGNRINSVIVLMDAM